MEGPDGILGGSRKKNQEFHTGVHKLIMVRLGRLELFLRPLPPRLGGEITGISINIELYMDTDSAFTMDDNLKKTTQDILKIDTRPKCSILNA